LRFVGCLPEVERPIRFDPLRIVAPESEIPEEAHVIQRDAFALEFLKETVGALLEQGLFPIGIGGGHDLTYPFAGAVAAGVGPLAGVYLDAHLDVRSDPGSGMAFRRLVEDGAVRELHVHGLDPLANDAEDMRWFQSHGGRVDPFGRPESGSSDPHPD